MHPAFWPAAYTLVFESAGEFAYHCEPTRTFKGTATYVFKVCQVGTTICSNEAKIVIK
ncbi:MAG: hypothetical protein H0T44_01790 [Gemmatimonadales bacterium]|nr:hypothetical protein [Gemmatimonadales bacterium]